MFIEGNQIHNFYAVTVRTFVIPFYYSCGSGYAKFWVLNYGSGSATAKSYTSYGSGSAILPWNQGTYLELSTFCS
jgi:hypothetical protein